MATTPTPRRRLVRGLVFAGGLLKAVMLVGGMRAFEEDTAGLADLRVTGGSSSGAIIAALVATGWTADEIADQLIDRTHVIGDFVRENPFSFSKLTLLWRLVRRRGLDDGSLLYETLGRLLSRHASGNNPDETFAEVFARTGRALVITTSCYTDCIGLQLFSTKTTPHTPIRTALRASAAYPGIMLPAEIDGRVHYDGGITCNYPLMYIQEQYPEFRDACYGLTYDFSRRNEVAHAWFKEEWPGITDIMINVVSMLYFRVEYLESRLTYRYDDFTVRIPVDEVEDVVVVDGGKSSTTGQTPRYHSPEKLFQLVADVPAMRQMFIHGLTHTTAWLHAQNPETFECAATQSDSSVPLPTPKQQHRHRRRRPVEGAATAAVQRVESHTP